MTKKKKEASRFRYEISYMTYEGKSIEIFKIWNASTFNASIKHTQLPPLTNSLFLSLTFHPTDDIKWTK